ncbi:MAG TPA: hypothetical protein VN656_01045 [Stellaceae bacterium]|nr:hypothetical protein [Stellaceae bacterium]
MDSVAPVSNQTSVTMRCDPWGPVIARLVFCSICGWLLFDNATSFKPWAPGTDWAGALFGLAVIGAGLWGVVGWLASSLMVDRASNRLLLNRFSLWTRDDEHPRPIPLDEIDAVVLTPQRRAQLLLPNRIELRLKDDEKVPVSTICSLMWGMAIQGKRLAEAINCRYEEQEEPDKKA